MGVLALRFRQLNLLVAYKKRPTCDEKVSELRVREMISSRVSIVDSLEF
jgi:hypothetical protein